MLRDIRIASQCSADWNRMSGDDRVRFCPGCRLNVYNFSAMTHADVETVVAAREGRLCARLYQRTDGTMLTQNCPAALREAIHRTSRVAASVFSAFLAVSPVLAAAAQQKQDAPLVQVKPFQAPVVLEGVDINEAVIAKAQVTLINESTGAVTTAETDSAGQIRVSGLIHGKYKISIIYPGFQAFQMKHISLPLKTPPQYQLKLGVLMGDVVAVPMSTQTAPISDRLSEPTNSTSTGFPMGVVIVQDNRDSFRKFFSRLRHHL
jgi:Carboxypeptidase regulatory-like domain